MAIVLSPQSHILVFLGGIPAKNNAMIKILAIAFFIKYY
jgi:hypothetical protein